MKTVNRADNVELVAPHATEPIFFVREDRRHEDGLGTEINERSLSALDTGAFASFIRCLGHPAALKADGMFGWIRFQGRDGGTLASSFHAV